MPIKKSCYSSNVNLSSYLNVKQATKCACVGCHNNIASITFSDNATCLGRSNCPIFICELTLTEAIDFYNYQVFTACSSYLEILWPSPTWPYSVYSHQHCNYAVIYVNFATLLPYPALTFDQYWGHVGAWRIISHQESTTEYGDCSYNI